MLACCTKQILVFLGKRRKKRGRIIGTEKKIHFAFLIQRLIQFSKIIMFPKLLPMFLSSIYQTGLLKQLEWFYGWLDGWMDRWMDEQIDEQIDRQMIRQIDSYIDRQIDIWLDEWILVSAISSSVYCFPAILFIIFWWFKPLLPKLIFRFFFFFFLSNY